MGSVKSEQWGQPHCSDNSKSHSHSAGEINNGPPADIQTLGNMLYAWGSNMISTREILDHVIVFASSWFYCCFPKGGIKYRAQDISISDKLEQKISGKTHSSAHWWGCWGLFHGLVSESEDTREWWQSLHQLIQCLLLKERNQADMRLIYSSVIEMLLSTHILYLQYIQFHIYTQYISPYYNWH